MKSKIKSRCICRSVWNLKLQSKEPVRPCSSSWACWPSDWISRAWCKSILCIFTWDLDQEAKAERCEREIDHGKWQTSLHLIGLLHLLDHSFVLDFQEAYEMAQQALAGHSGSYTDHRRKWPKKVERCKQSKGTRSDGWVCLERTSFRTVFQVGPSLWEFLSI